MRSPRRPRGICPEIGVAWTLLAGCPGDPGVQTAPDATTGTVASTSPGESGSGAPTTGNVPTSTSPATGSETSTGGLATTAAGESSSETAGESSSGSGSETGDGDSPGVVVDVEVVDCIKPAFPSATCRTMTVQCDGIADMTASLEIDAPAGAPVGTVILTSGGGGDGLYSDRYVFAPELIGGLNDAGYTTVQLAWPPEYGFMQGPGGMRRLACRYATLATWIHDNLHAGGDAAAFCATGNSGGAAQIAYSLAHYGLGDRFDMVQLTGGPPMGRIDHGCLCDLDAVSNPCGTLKPEKCYTGNAVTLIDVSYADMSCTLQDAGQQATFRDDSVAAPDATLDYPNTTVHAFFGAMDDTVAVGQAFLWLDQITSEHSAECVPGTGHNVPNTDVGAQTMLTDLTTHCTP
jgi:hypothetical protein